MKGPHISIRAETLFTLFDFKITNSLLLGSFVFIFFGLLAFWYQSEIKKDNKSIFFYLITFILKSLYNLFESVFGNKVGYFFPLVGAFFFYILLHNWSGLLPGVGSVLIKVQEGNHSELVPLLRGNTTDLNSTLSLALISLAFSQYVGVRELGLVGYIKKRRN